MKTPRREPIYQGEPRDATKPGRGLYGIGHGWWALIAVLYILSPFDIAPEFFLGPLGLADDLGVATFALYSVVNWWKARRASRNAPAR